MNTPEIKPDAAHEISQIAHYKIIGKLGQGGMSVVYKAIDQRLKRAVAVKMLHPFLANTKEYRTRFFREAASLARLDHPNIVQIFDVANPQKNPEQLYIVTEFLEGKTLKDFIANKNENENKSLLEIPELSAMIIWQVALALEHAHQKGIIHRDIKPENIMIKHDGQIKLMDFGIASIGGDDGLTQAGTLLGSFAHLAPEVITGQKITAQSDIFSLSTVFYWLLSNQLPFSGDSPHALLKNIVDKRAKRIQQLSPFVVDHLANLVEKGMAKSSKERFRSAQHMADAIEEFLGDVGLIIDVKRMTHALGAPATELVAFKAWVLERIHKKVIFYQEQNNQEQVLALQCRLETNPSNLHKPQKQGKTRMLFASLVLASVGFASFFLLTPKNQQIPPAQTPPAPRDLFDQAQSIDPNLEENVSLKLDNIEIKDPVIKPKTGEKAAEWQTINLVIWPFANVFIDGQKMASDTKSLTIKLTKGMHHLEFTHDYAATVEKKLQIDAVTKPVDIKINLHKSKPAFLVINSNIEADIAVNGHYKGSSKNSMLNPMVIPIPDKKHGIDAEVIIQRNGYQTQIHRVELTAGKIRDLSITLTALADTDSRRAQDVP